LLKTVIYMGVCVYTYMHIHTHIFLDLHFTVE